MYTIDKIRQCSKCEQYKFAKQFYGLSWEKCISCIRLDKKVEKLIGYDRRKSEAREQIREKGCYAKFKKDYKDKIIDYPDSPTGKAYVGINKKPFMPAVDNSYGFQGVILQDDERRFVQCHVCGKWAKKITSGHVKSHGLTMNEYKDKYGLYRTKGLVSDETSLRLTKAALKNKVSIGKRGMKGRKRPILTKRGSEKTAFQNRYSTCPEQIKQRTYEFIRYNRELPSQQNRGNALYKILARRYGTFGKGLQALGLPHFKRQGTNYIYTFPDHTIYKFNINQFYDREALYNMMLSKCKALQDN